MSFKFRLAAVSVLILAGMVSCTSPESTPILIPPTNTNQPSRTVTASPEPSHTITFTATSTKTPTPTPTNPPTQTATITPTSTPDAHICDPAVRYLPGHFFAGWPVDPNLPFRIDRSYSYGEFRDGNPIPHHGIDLTLSAGTDVWAVDDGVVVFAGADIEVVYGGFENYYGNLVILQHSVAGYPDTILSLYGHLSEVAVKTWDSVETGDVIGKVGNTGIATGSHLHFEVRFGDARFDQTFNPELWLPPRGTEEQPRGTVAGYILGVDGDPVLVDNLVIQYFERDDLPAHTTTYTSTTLIPGLNSDPYWQESFSAMDLIAGHYRFSFYLNGWEELNFEVKPNQITLIGYCL